MPVDTIFPLSIQSFLFQLCRPPAAFYDRRDGHVAHEALGGIGAGAKTQVVGVLGTSHTYLGIDTFQLPPTDMDTVWPKVGKVSD